MDNDDQTLLHSDHILNNASIEQAFALSNQNKIKLIQIHYHRALIIQLLSKIIEKSKNQNRNMMNSIRNIGNADVLYEK